jgi:hypothetical protein
LYNGVILNYNKEVLIHASAGMNLKNTMLSRSQTQKPTYHVIPLMCNVHSRQIHKDKIKSVIGNARAQENVGVTASWTQDFFLDNENALELVLMICNVLNILKTTESYASKSKMINFML